MKSHYKVGSNYDYVPTFLKSDEGLITLEKKGLAKAMNKLKAAEFASTDTNEIRELRDHIVQIEQLLKTTKSSSYSAKQKFLSQNYVNITPPNEASEVLFKTEQAINKASFVVGRGAAEEAIDIQRNSFLKAIKDNENWVINKDMPAEHIPKHFKQLNGTKYGELNGYYVERGIAQNIDDVGEATNAFIRNWDKVLGFWKLGKAVWNPATQVANGASNVYLAWLGGVNPADLKTYSQAAQALKVRSKNKWFKEAEGWGLMNNTFSAAELSQFRKSIDSFRTFPEKVSTGQGVKDAIGKVFQTPATLYETSEQYFKMAVFIKSRKKGLSIDASAKRAEEYLFNYRDIPPIVKHYKRWASPFFTFTYKATGLFAKEVVRHPWKFALTGAGYMGWQRYAEKATGTSPEQVKKEKEGNYSIGTFDLLLPWKDNQGNNQYWNLERIMPMGQYAQELGQTGLPLGSFSPTANPLISATYEIVANKNIFTGKEVYNTDIDGIMGVIGKSFLHTYKEAAPSLAPGNYGYESLKKGIKSLDTEMKTYSGTDVTLQDTILRTIFAIKVSPATELGFKKSLLSEIRKVDRGIGTRLYSLKAKYQRGEITEDELGEGTKKLMEQKKFLKENLVESLSL